MREPSFWWRDHALAGRLLAPLAAVYGAVAARRLGMNGERAAMPIICIGNPTVGGAGKTPLALEVARMLAKEGERPAFLTRGYGGRLAGPLQVDPQHHLAADVGDEPLLLARAAPTIVARDRVKGARAALAAVASVIVMDDGFQNPSLAKDFSVLVVDAARGVGNGRVLPAGPLRAPLDRQLERAHALVVVGTSSVASSGTAAAEAAVVRHIPVFRARLEPDVDVIASLQGTRVLAFAGIGYPEKFFASLRDAGIVVAGVQNFPDHHRYTKVQAQALCAEADRNGLVLLTTEKDLARMQGDGAATELASRTSALPVRLTLDDEAGFKALLMERLAAARCASPSESPS